jgi:glutaconate CoA-transferase subunit B
VPEEAFTTDEMMTVAAARQLRNGTVCFVGIGLPSEAANLARRLHAPECVLIYESGCIGAQPSVLPRRSATASWPTPPTTSSRCRRSSTTGSRAAASTSASWALPRSTGSATSTPPPSAPYGQPTVRLPGTGGAPEIASSAKEVIVVLRHSRRTFIEHLDFVSSAGYLWGKGAREQLGLLGAGPTVVITDLGVLTPDPDTRELTLASVHPGRSVADARAATGWELRVADQLTETEPPTRQELATLRALKEAVAPGG